MVSKRFASNKKGLLRWSLMFESATEEMAVQNREIIDLLAVLTFTDKRIFYYKGEGKELLNTINELYILQLDLIKWASLLTVAKEKIAFQMDENTKMSDSFMHFKRKMKRLTFAKKESIQCLKKMMFLNSHKMRIPVTNILGLSEVLDDCISTPEKLVITVQYIKEAAVQLDIYTRELAVCMDEFETTVKFKYLA